MRVYDSVAADQLDGLELYLSKLSDDEIQEMGSFFKNVVRKVTGTFKKVHAPIVDSRVGRAVRRIHKDVVDHVRKVFTKKYFMKMAPYLSVAAQLLNFVVPGLGVAVGFAISAASTALSIAEAKKARKAMNKAEDQANKEVREAEAQADAEANKALDASYAKGELFFTSAYQMTPVKWGALPVEGKVKFLNIAIYDKHAEAMQKMGVTRDAFQVMSVGEEMEALSKMAEVEKLPGTPNVPLETTPQDVVTIPVDASGKAIGPIPSIAALTGGEWYTDPVVLGGGALVAILAVAVVAKMRRRSS